MPDEYIAQSDVNGDDRAIPALDIAVVSLVNNKGQTLVEAIGDGLTPLFTDMNLPGTSHGTATTEKEHGQVSGYGYPYYAKDPNPGSGDDMWRFTGWSQLSTSQPGVNWRYIRIHDVYAEGGQSGSPCFCYARHDGEEKLMVVGVINGSTKSEYDGRATAAPLYRGVFDVLEKAARADKGGMYIQ